MPLSDLAFEVDDRPIPGDVRRFLREAERRIEELQRESRVPGFVSSNLEQAYRVLRVVAEAHAKPGALFCEWGSGLGVVACMAAMLDFDSVGIEIEEELVDAARKLADDFELPVEFLRGSFIPHGAEIHIDVGRGFAWLKGEEAGRDELAFDADDFDVIFAYPWPDEEDVTGVLFERYGAAGALMISHHGGDIYRLRRKLGKKSRH